MPSQRPPFPAGQTTRATASSPEGHETQSRGRESFRCNTRHQHIKCGHMQRLAASRREHSSTEGQQQHPERMIRACAVSIMNAYLHELVWVLGA